LSGLFFALFNAAAIRRSAGLNGRAGQTGRRCTLPSGLSPSLPQRHWLHALKPEIKGMPSG